MYCVAQAERNDFWVGLGLWLNFVSYHNSLSNIFCFDGNCVLETITLQSRNDSADSAGGLNVPVVY